MNSLARIINRSFPIVMILIALCAMTTQRAAAQLDDGGGGSTSSGGTSTGTGGAYFNYSDQGEYIINVNLWGFVGSPGRYSVPSTTTLIQLISLAGGPTDRARLSDIRILHDMTVDSTIVEPINVFNLEVYQQTADSSLNPILTDGDTIIVPGDALNVFREILGIFRDIALVVGTLVGLIFAFRN
ncbi:MAG: SLBB domain-containing protein [bacterium]|nr:SLBB domain-containing protein [Candidatus Kapabacteria bacterium]